jgi:predicted TIM-barrel fold metal-dependent hydrolase
MSDTAVRHLEEHLAAAPVVDCHEHTFLPGAAPARVDLAVLIANSDVGDDMISAGMPEELRHELTWATAAPYLERVRNTGFYRSLILAFRELFGFDGDDLTEGDWQSISERLAAGNGRTDWYEEVLTRHGRIEAILRIRGDEADPYDLGGRWFAPVIPFDPWIVARDPSERERLAASVGGRASTLDEYLAALDAAVADVRTRGGVGVKSALAYRRDLGFGLVEAGDAARLYERRSPEAPEARALEDFLVHAVADRAGAHGLPYQMHVGYGSWQRNIAAGANPLLLNPLIEAHRATRFVLLHGGYPFIGELATMAKNHPNVYLECGWLAYIAPAAYRRAMAEWLDAVPANKLLAVGADCLHVEQTLGALLLTRRQLALALADKVGDGGWSMPLAEVVGRRLLARNAQELYRLDEGGEPFG